MRSLVPTLSLLVVAPLLLGGCTDLKRALGMEKVVPDEFAVVQSAPLAMPPDYSLRPPRPGARPTQEVSPTEQARQTIFRAGETQQAPVPGADQLSPGENTLLRQAGAAVAPSDIRETVNKEAAQTVVVDESFADKLLFWRSSPAPVGVTDNVVNPQQEALRLKSAQAGDASPEALAQGTPAAAGPGQGTPSASAPGAAAPAHGAAAASPAPPTPELLGPPTIERSGNPKTG